MSVPPEELVVDDVDDVVEPDVPPPDVPDVPELDPPDVPELPELPVPSPLPHAMLTNATKPIQKTIPFARVMLASWAPRRIPSRKNSDGTNVLGGPALAPGTRSRFLGKMGRPAPAHGIVDP